MGDYQPHLERPETNTPFVSGLQLIWVSPLSALSLTVVSDLAA